MRHSSDVDGLAVDPAILDAVGAPVIVADLEGVIRAANAAGADLTGRPRATLLGLPLWEALYEPPLRAAARDAVEGLLGEAARRAAHTPSPGSATANPDSRARIVGGPGQAHPAGEWAIQGWVARLVVSAGRAACLVLTGTEAHRRRRAIHALAETEGRYEALVKLSPDSIVVHQDWRVVFANPSAARLLGAADPADLLGRSPLDFVDPADRAVVRGRIEHLLANGGSVPLMEQRHLRLDGQVVDVEVTASAVAFNGRPAIEYIARDVRDRKRAEAALRESEARIRAIFDESSIGMLLLDPEGHCISTNRALQRLLGYDGAELAAMTIRDITHPEDLALTGDALRGLFAGRTGSIEMEKRYVRRDGSVLTAHVYASPVLDEAGVVRYSATIMEDISARALLEEQLRQATKMEAIGRLAGGVAHDMNNLLTAMSGFGRLALEAAVPGSAQEGDIAEILKAADRAAALTSQLLAFGRRHVMQLRVVDLGEVVRGIVPMLSRLIGEDVVLAVDTSAGPDPTFADPGYLEQVLVNLAVNARDAMPSGGTLTIGTSGAEVDEAFAREHVGLQNGRYVRLVVSDTGVGMEEGVLDHIFEPFYTTKERGRGTGLGLSSVFGIVQQLNGAIYAASEPGRGTTFTIYLPGTDRRAERPPAERAPASPRGGHETILVVEDEPSVRDLAVRILAGWGYRVLCAPSGEAALQVARDSGPVDLLFTDMVMTGMNGAERARRLQVEHPACPALYASGYTDDAAVHRGVLDPGTAFLAKPYSATDLLERVRAVLDAGPAVAGRR